MEQNPGDRVPRAIAFIGALGHASTSTITSADKYSAPTVPVTRSVSYGGGGRVIAASSPTVLSLRSSSVATPQYPSFPGSRASTACVNLDEFDSDCSRSMDITSPVSSAVMDKGCESLEESSDMNYPGSSGVVDQEGVSSVESGEVVPPDIPGHSYNVESDLTAEPSTVTSGYVYV